jgi:glucose-1-phosphate thymidylyltransferase
VAVHPEANRERLHLVGVVELKEDMYIKVMEEKPARPKSDLACCPIYLFPPSALKLVYVYLEEGGNPDAPGHFLSWLVARMPVRAFLFHEPVYALDSIEMYYWLNDNAERVDKELGYGRAVGKTE